MINKTVSYLLFFVTLILLSFNTIADDSTDCFGALQVVQVQGVKQSFSSRWSKMEPKLDDITKLIKATGSESGLGLASFGDKNLAGVRGLNKRTSHRLGSDSFDYCLSADLPVGDYSPGNIKRIFNAYKTTALNKSGAEEGDFPEGVFEALYRAMKAKNLETDALTSKSQKVLRAFLVVTDATSHIEGDVPKLTNEEVPPFAMRRQSYENENHRCRDMDYAPVKQAADLANDMDAVVYFLVPKQTKYMERNNEKTVKVKEWYERKTRDAGFNNLIITEMDDEMVNYGEVFKTIVAQFNQHRCPLPTAVVPVTTTP